MSIPPMGLPVVSTHWRVLDIHHKLMIQETARGDLIFVRGSVEIAVMPVNSRPFLRWSELTPGLESLLEKECPTWTPDNAHSRPDWKRCDEERWEEEIAALFAVLVEWMQANGQLTMTYEMWQTAAVAPKLE